MTYLEWFESHAAKHAAIVKKLLDRGFAKAEIIDYFDFDNMCEAEPDFCPLYAEKRKCHDMERLNCYLCACPWFRFDDNGLDRGNRESEVRNWERGTQNPEPRTKNQKTRYSRCAINAKDGKPLVFGNAIHQVCSACLLPHRRSFVEKHFDTDWKKIMKECGPHG
jgi:hypothetical protein